MKEINGINYHHICTAGDYPQGKITVEFLNSVVKNYNVNFHESPTWIGHTNFSSLNLGVDEPRAMGWIRSLYLDGDKLYASFSKVTWEMEFLLSEEYFKFCSCEFVMYLINEVEVPYLYALALTNRPAVFGMEPLKVKADEKHVTNNNYVGQPIRLTQINLQTQNINVMNENLKKIATKLGLDLTKFVTDSSLQEAIDIKLTELTKSKTPDPTPAPAKEDDNPDARYAALEAKIKKLEDDSQNSDAVSLADNAVIGKKILPAQREGIIEFAKSNLSAAKKYVDSLPVITALSATKITTSGAGSNLNLEDPKFKTADGKEITFSDVLKDPSLIQKFTDEELKAMDEKEKEIISNGMVHRGKEPVQ